ncbi:uncharacterized protein LOC117170574 [Belonocnema kinseyi]|uniref:uncharacterized protein LOC117170574 n=1 Tax=Belonocnema kinseyi TaxID=2817044 RepID=UPI00143DBAA5|nr:uncharacterized protein LOC117170574 [Belonocnema kinseyi]
MPRANCTWRSVANLVRSPTRIQHFRLWILVKGYGSGYSAFTTARQFLGFWVRLDCTMSRFRHLSHSSPWSCHPGPLLVLLSSTPILHTQGKIITLLFTLH